MSGQEQNWGLPLPTLPSSLNLGTLRKESFCCWLLFCSLSPLWSRLCFYLLTCMAVTVWTFFWDKPPPLPLPTDSCTTCVQALATAASGSQMLFSFGKVLRSVVAEWERQGGGHRTAVCRATVVSDWGKTWGVGTTDVRESD